MDDGLYAVAIIDKDISTAIIRREYDSLKNSKIFFSKAAKKIIQRKPHSQIHRAVIKKEIDNENFQCYNFSIPKESLFARASL